MSLFGVHIESIASNGQGMFIIQSGILTLSKAPISKNPTTSKCQKVCSTFRLEENSKLK